MVLILPATVISSVWAGLRLRLMKIKDGVIAILCFAMFSAVWISISNISHSIVPLNPKSAFVHATTSLHLNVLLPMSGGSGPLGFYVSLLFLFVFWALSLVAFIASVVAKSEKIKKISLIVIATSSLVYAINVSSEYLFGVNYGSAPKVVNDLLSYTLSHDEIKQVVTYNDAGAYTLINSQKYFKRFYSDPAFVEDNKDKLRDYHGFYLVLDFPAINSDSVYAQYFETCKSVYESDDKLMNGDVFDCRDADNTIFNK
jgi:hypothetical protein